MPVRRAAALGETFEGLVFDWEGTGAADDQAGAARLRRRIEELCTAGVHVFVVSRAQVAKLDVRLGARPAGRGTLHLCCQAGLEIYEVGRDGPALAWRQTPTAPESIAGTVHSSPGISDAQVPCDLEHLETALVAKSESARFAAAWLSRRGITGSLVLVVGGGFGPVGGFAGSDFPLLVSELSRAVVVSVGDEPGGAPSGVIHLGGGPATFDQLLDEQMRRRAEGRVPGVDLDPAWVVPLPAGRLETRVAESLGTVANGLVGTRASLEEDGPEAAPLVIATGVFTQEGQLVEGPLWTNLALRGPLRHPSDERFVDLRTGVLTRLPGDPSGLRSVRFVSAARPHALALRAEGLPTHLEGGPALAAPPSAPASAFRHERRHQVELATTGFPPGSRITLAARESARTVVDARGSSHHRRVVERLGAWEAASSGTPSFDAVLEQLGAFDAIGYDALLAEHREAWARRWADAAVTIEGSPGDELAARFAVFHLLSAAPDDGEAAVGARGLSGTGYGGHVFWDADVFVLPALAAIRPPAARAMLEYRIRRLPAARARAKAQGRRGARFPWESAGDGSDVTPGETRDRHGEIVPILTGQREEHIVADVAWAAARYASWAGDDAFLRGAGRRLVTDTARYWASRIRLDGAGRGHLDGVMGPDEYHQEVDDNAFTNVMARWNLRLGATLIGQSRGSSDAACWLRLASNVVDGWHADRLLYEQFAGYFDLEPLLISEVATPPVAADVLLGTARTSGSQVIKQADVLMLHHLVPEEVVPGSLGPCLQFYEPRTAHGSSLSPAVHASLWARAGHPERALRLFRSSARIDLDDVTGTTAGGIHLAAMGGLWQSLAYGFLGLRADGETLAVDPCLPAEWHALGLRFRFRGKRVGVRADQDRVVVDCDAPLEVRIGGGRPELCRPPEHVFRSR